MAKSIVLLLVAVVTLVTIATAAPPSESATIGALTTVADTITPDLPNMDTDATVPPVPNPLEISSPYGPRWKASQSRDDFHRGIDYFDAIGTPIVNVQDGTIFQIHTEAGNTMPGGGNVVIVKHVITQTVSPSDAEFHSRKLTGGVYFSYYLHLNTITAGLAVDAIVTKGQQLGTMGQTGETSFTHLHFETRLQGYCSYQYQFENNRVPSATSTCNTGFDPHVNPYFFVGGAATGAKSMEEVKPLPGHVWAVRYNATRGHMDIDVVQSNLGRISFTTRSGMRNISSITALDNLGDITSYMALRPGYFISTNTAGVAYELHFKSQKPQWVGVYDIHGNGIKWSDASATPAPGGNGTTSSASAKGGSVVAMLVAVLMVLLGTM